MTQEIIDHAAALVEEKGTDVWWQAPEEALLPPSLKAQADSFVKGTDTMDVYVPGW